MPNPHAMLLLVVVWFSVVDLVRKFFGGSVVLLAMSDLLVLVLVLSVLVKQPSHYVRRAVEIAPILAIFVGMLVFLVLLQALNPENKSAMLSVAGLRSYLMYIPAVLVGMAILSPYADLQRYFRVLLIVILPVMLMSVYQVTVGVSELPDVLASMDHNYHSYGDQAVELISATFASSKRYGRYLFLTFPFVYGLAAGLRKPTYVKVLLSTIYLLAAVISGAKEGLVVLLLFHAYLFIFNSESVRHAVIKVAIIMMGVGAIWSTMLNFDYSSINAENYRYKFILSNQQDWKYRFDIYLREPFELLDERYDTTELVFGTGVGTYGQETRLVGSEDAEKYYNIRKAGDSGIAKLVVELGFFGFAYFVTVMVVISVWGLISSFSCARRDWRLLALCWSFIPFGWIILAIKAHGVISDGMMAFGFWLSIGGLLAIKDASTRLR